MNKTRRSTKMLIPTYGAGAYTEGSDSEVDRCGVRYAWDIYRDDCGGACPGRALYEYANCGGVSERRGRCRDGGGISDIVVTAGDIPNSTGGGAAGVAVRNVSAGERIFLSANRGTDSASSFFE
jgi:hypothetical protein